MIITQFTLEVLKKAMALDTYSEFVFSYKGGPVIYSTYARRVHTICEEAGVIYHNPHSARSYIASKLNTGANISQMCDYFGWSDKKMALRYCVFFLKISTFSDILLRRYEERSIVEVSDRLASH